MSEKPRLDEQAISKVAETVLSDQIDTAQKLDVDIRTDPLKMVGGEIDSVSIAGKELVTQQDLQIQEMELHTDRVDDEIIVNGDLHKREFIAFYVKGDRVLAAASSKRDPETAAIYELMRLDRMPSPEALRNNSLDLVSMLRSS